jgi:hypothetical protein
MPAQQSAIVATAHRVYNRLAYGLRELVSAGAIEGGQVSSFDLLQKYIKILISGQKKTNQYALMTYVQ